MSRPHPTSSSLRLILSAVASLALVAGVLTGQAGIVTVTAAAASTTPPPRTPAGLPSAIETSVPYQEQTACDPVVRPGTRKLATLLATTYRSTGAGWNSTYACGTDGTRSEHYDGRAIDWMVDVRNAGQHAAAQAVLAWLLATDRAGNRFAMARRLGVMYVIYDNRMWGAWSGRWEDYNHCTVLKGKADANACHRTHMHISLSWNGAMGTTSFWTKRLSPTNYGPCRPADLNWAPRYRAANPTPCRDYPMVRAAKGASATKKGLVTWSGAYVRSGRTGPAVSAVQRALHVPVTGSYGAVTTAAVRRFQAAHRGLPVTGAMNQPTWRVLLAAVR